MIIHKEQVPYRFPDGRNGWKLITSYINKEGKVAFLQYPIPQDQMFEWKYATRGNADPPFYDYDYKGIFLSEFLTPYRRTKVTKLFHLFV